MTNRRIQSNHLPPYVAYSTWRRLLESLNEAIPAKLDRSLYDRLGFSGTQIFTLKSSLYFFDLITRDDVPTEKLHQFIAAKGDKRKEILNKMVREAYLSLFAKLDVRTATSGQLSDHFESLYAKGDIRRKCSSFFLSVASEAGIELSPHFFKRAKSGLGRKKEAVKIRAEVRERTHYQLPMFKKSWEELLLDKFPDFDPAWPEAIKKAWFEDFRLLQQMKYPGPGITS